MSDLQGTPVTPAVVSEVATNRRNEKVGVVVSTKMQKTIVVEIEMRKAHPLEEIVRRSSLSEPVAPKTDGTAVR